jgi:hypothetical protein
MVRTAGRARLLWQALACTTLASCLAACGGGGGGGSPTPPDNGGSSTPESAWLLAEFVATDSNRQFVRVWDPASPTVAIQNVLLVQSNGIVWTSSHLVFSDATRYDAGTQLVTTLGHAKVFFDNDGKLYSIDLRGGQSHAPVQLSSAVDVFLPAGATPMNAAGDDAWIDAQGGSHHWAIRSTMSAADAPVPVLKIVAPLRDATTGLPQYFFASLGERSGTHVTPTTFEVVDTSFTLVSIPEVTAMTGSDGWVGADPAQAGLGYLRLANQLRALHWSAGAVSVDTANLYGFAAFSQAPSVADAQSLYFNDGGALLAATNGSVSTVGAFSAMPDMLVDAGDYVAATEITTALVSQTFHQLETVRKSDGHLTLLEDASPDLQLLGATDQSLVLAGTPEQGQAFVLASGDNGTRTTLGSQYVGVVRSASARADQPAAPVALLSCVAGIASGFCAPGALTQLDFSGGSMTLGTLAATAPWVRADATAGLATSLPGQTFLPTTAGFGGDETDGRDAWQFMPAGPSSVVRVTSNLP